MVKPTLKPDSEKEKKEDALKDDKLKEWGILPAAVVIDETEKEKDKKDAEAAITEFENLETDVQNGPRPVIVKFCACFAVFTVILIITCTIGSFLYFHHANKENHKWKGWCSVKYDGDNNRDGSKEGGRHGSHHGDHHGDSSSSEEHHGRRPNWQYPRPTGPPGGRGTCNQQSEVDIDEQYERIERPQEEDCERLTILHDYNANMSAYRLWKSGICYVTWIDTEVLMDPVEFWTNMQDPEYLNQYFSELTVTYRAVLPAIPTPLHEQENGKYGEYLDGPKDFLCDGAETYWIEKIPEEEIEEFMALVEEIIRELIAIAEAGEQQGEGQEEGGHGGEIPELPWNTDEPWDDNVGDMDDGDDAWPMDGWHTGYRPHGGQGEFPGMPPHEGRHHGGHHGERHGGARKRRGAVGNHMNLKQQAAKKVKDAVACLPRRMREIGKGSKISEKLVFTECIMEKVEERRRK